MDYGSLPPKERLSRFAEILHRGACRSQARRPNGIKYQAVDLTETEQKILQAIEERLERSDKLPLYDITIAPLMVC